MAVSDGVVERSWGQVLKRVTRIAGGLRALGLRPGDRVAVLANNTPAFHELYFTAPWAGLVMASLNTRWSRREMIDALNDCSASVLMVDEAFEGLAAELSAGAPSVRHLLDSQAWEALAENGPALEDSSRAAEDPAYIFYTGGTTGRAKGVMLSALNFYAAGLSSLHTAGVSARSIYAIGVPLFHMSGGGLVAGQLAAAASARLIARFEPEASMAAVEASHATHVVWVPTMLTMVLSHPAFGRYDLSSLERIIYGSAPMPAAILERAMAAMPGVHFTQYYGMTEVTGNATWLGPDVHEPSDPPNPRLRSVGTAAPGVEVRVIGGDGAEAPANTVGEVCIRGPTLTQGYWGDAKATRDAIVDGWMHTGDLGRIDGEGYLYVVDRLKDMIITGGENVYSSEVENALHAHPGVKECAVIGLPDDHWGEIVCAVVHLAAGAELTAEALIDHCRTRIGGYKIPKRILFSADPLPKSAAGKILKVELREAYGVASASS
jgi:long-chain acyl-CoA synthetase